MGGRPAPTMPPAVRLVTGLAVLVAGGVHLWLWWRGGYRHAPGGVGPAFLADAALSAVVGAWILLRADRRAAWAGAALAAVALAGYGLARTVGLNGFVETRCVVLKKEIAEAKAEAPYRTQPERQTTTFQGATKFCKQCGARVRPIDRFCASCGHRFER